MDDPIQEAVNRLGAVRSTKCDWRQLAIMTTVWRKRAYEMFGFEAGAYRFGHGKVALFDDLFAMAQRAAARNDGNLPDRVFDYVAWAVGQNAEDLRSAVDIAFVMPVCRDARLSREAGKRLPEDLLASKRTLSAERD